VLSTLKQSGYGVTSPQKARNNCGVALSTSLVIEKTNR